MLIPSQERGTHELYAADSEAADYLVWGRNSDPLTRRAFPKNSGLTGMSTTVGVSIPFAHLKPGGSLFCW